MGSGLIGAGFREIPAVAINDVRRIDRKLKALGLGGILAIGQPNQPLFDVPVAEGRAGMVVCGGLLAFRGLRHRTAGGQLVSFDAWFRDPVTLARFLSVPLGLLFYVFTSDFLGFHIAATVAMLAWLLVFGLKPLPAIALAIAFPIVMHLAFYKLLRVPLPWGLLQSVVFP